jgi:predicted nuclease of predicted toxin-antitoxin system
VKLLVDECCDPRLVAALRQAGHDVRYVLESDAGASDEHLAALSIEQDRILITEDKDFGELIVRHGKPLPGVILIRIVPENRRLKPARVLALLARQGKRLSGNYAVVDETSVRLRPHCDRPLARSITVAARAIEHVGLPQVADSAVGIALGAVSGQPPGAPWVLT